MHPSSLTANCWVKMWTIPESQGERMSRTCCYDSCLLHILVYTPRCCNNPHPTWNAQDADTHTWEAIAQSTAQCVSACFNCGSTGHFIQVFRKPQKEMYQDRAPKTAEDGSTLKWRDIADKAATTEETPETAHRDHLVTTDDAVPHHITITNTNKTASQLT